MCDKSGNAKVFRPKQEKRLISIIFPYYEDIFLIYTHDRYFICPHYISFAHPVGCFYRCDTVLGAIDRDTFPSSLDNENHHPALHGGKAFHTNNHWRGGLYSYYHFCHHRTPDKSRAQYRPFYSIRIIPIITNVHAI